MVRLGICQLTTEARADGLEAVRRWPERLLRDGEKTEGPARAVPSEGTARQRRRAADRVDSPKLEN
jgi:hypothetical protein